MHKQRAWSLRMQIQTLWSTAKKYWLYMTLGFIFMYVLIAVRVFETSKNKNIDIREWWMSSYFACDLNFAGHGNKFAVLRNVHLDIYKRTFHLSCGADRPKYSFHDNGIVGNILTIKREVKGNPLNNWMRNLSYFDVSEIKKQRMSTFKTTTFVVHRIEAHNLYHAMCEWYSVFLTSKMLNFVPKETDIVFIDDRPPNNLDETWSTLFREVTRYKFLPPDNVFKNLVWNTFGYESLMNTPSLQTIPYLEHFRQFVLQSYGIRNKRLLQCNRLQITIILRRDYRSHPELTNGTVLRKFANDSDIIDAVENYFVWYDVKGMYLEEYSMKQQLEIITNTDILVGMHGAGLSHTLFLPDHAGCFEIFPKYVGDLKFFEAFSRWRGIHYSSWRNSDPKNEMPGFRTRVPTEVLIQQINALESKICV